MNIWIPMEFSVWIPKMWTALLLSLTPRVSCASKVDTVHGFRTKVQWSVELTLNLTSPCLPDCKDRGEVMVKPFPVRERKLSGSGSNSWLNDMELSKQGERWLSAGEVEEVVGRDQQWTFGRGLGVSHPWDSVLFTRGVCWESSADATCDFYFGFKGSQAGHLHFPILKHTGMLCPI